MKRGNAGLRTARSVDVPEGEQGFWPSFADMMSSFALIMFFLMLISYLQNLITGNRLVSTEELLQETETNLQITTSQVDEAERLLSGLQIDLDDAQKAILEMQAEMARYAATIEGQTAQIEAQTAQIDEQTTLLSSQKNQLSEQAATINAQKEYIAVTNEELTRLRGQMQTIAFMRLSVLEKISESIGKTLGDTSKVSIGDNGSIILSEGLLFAFNSSEIMPDSYSMLDNLTASFVNFLSNPENAKYVDSIVISGHTDSTGSDAKNRSLSTARANAVLSYLLDENNGILKKYAPYFCAAGYGSTRPVADNSTEAGRSQNRRIEISIILKDETVLEIVDAYLKTELPGT